VFTVNGSVVIESNHPSESMDSSRFAPCVYYGYLNYNTGLIYEKCRLECRLFRCENFRNDVGPYKTLFNIILIIGQK
jgi:hypothetical protein